jgi:RNA polymerase sigma-70 factor (ECF subfamily)
VTLGEAFARETGDRDVDAEVQAALAAIWTAARAAWPDIDLPAEPFARRLWEIVSDRDSTSPLQTLQTIEAADLYLACACAGGDATAMRHFDRTYLAEVPLRLHRGEESSGFADEVRQLLRARLLVAAPGERPRIAGYSGRGPLGAWVRISAARVALNLRGKRTLRPGADAELQLHGALADPELSLVRKRHGKELRDALESALAALSPQDGAILRLYYLEQMSPDAIAGMYKTSKRTVQRRILDIRRAIVEAVRAALAERLRLSSTQLDSIVRLLSKDLDTSVLRVLKSPRR